MRGWNRQRKAGSSRGRNRVTRFTFYDGRKGGGRFFFAVFSIKPAEVSVHREEIFFKLLPDCHNRRHRFHRRHRNRRHRNRRHRNRRNHPTPPPRRHHQVATATVAVAAKPICGCFRYNARFTCVCGYHEKYVNVVTCQHTDGCDTRATFREPGGRPIRW